MDLNKVGKLILEIVKAGSELLHEVRDATATEEQNHANNEEVQWLK